MGSDLVLEESLIDWLVNLSKSLIFQCFLLCVSPSIGFVGNPGFLFRVLLLQGCEGLLHLS
jgi:hypothetical protein